MNLMHASSCVQMYPGEMENEELCFRFARMPGKLLALPSKIISHASREQRWPRTPPWGIDYGEKYFEILKLSLPFLHQCRMVVCKVQIGRKGDWSVKESLRPACRKVTA